MDRLVSGWYTIEWLNKAGEVFKTEQEYLHDVDYRRKVMSMQTQYLSGKDVSGLRVIPAPKQASR